MPLLYLLAVAAGADPTYKSQSSIAQAITSITHDKANYGSLIRSLVFAIVASLIQIMLALLLARVFFSKKFSVTRYLCLLVLPIGITPIAASLMWKALFDYQFGPINGVLSLFGASRIPWLSTSPFAFRYTTAFSEVNWGQVSVLIADSWLWVPFLVGAMLLAFSRVPVNLLESALLEGASKGRVFWSIILPLSRPYLLLLFFLRFVDSFRAFDTDWAFFGASPVTSHLSGRVYSQMFLERDYSLAACFAIAGAIVISPVSTLLLSLIRRSMILVREDQ